MKHPDDPKKPLITRVPYPQTTVTAKAWCKRYGVPLADLARHNDLPRVILSDLLRGQLVGLRGKAHQGAIVLGLKPDPTKTTA